MRNDLISREAVLKQIRKIECEPDYQHQGEDRAVGLCIAESIVEVAESAEPERISMVWKPSKGRPAYEKGICNCGYVLSVLQRDFVYCPKCGAKLVWSGNE